MNPWEEKQNIKINVAQTGEILEITKVPIIEKTKKEINQEKVKEKIEKLKKRLALKWLISEWDQYLRNDEYTSALKSYIQAHKENKADEQIIRKLADTYFKMHKFQTALKYYMEIIDWDGIDTNRVALTLLYSEKYTTPEEILKIKEDLNKIWLTKDEYFYYENSITCLIDFHQCKLQYDTYRKDLNTTWETIEKEITSHELLEIKESIRNYRNFQLDEIYFKDAIIIWGFYINKNYPIAIRLGEKLLQEKENYRPILKILADSYYKLWDYTNARKYLSLYYQLDKTDPWIAYLLWVVSSEFSDYVLSNIYLEKALENGYTPTIEIRRKLVYNYFLLESEENITHTFYELIEKEEEYQRNDLELAIYYYILYWEYNQATIWAKEWMERYPTEENFHGYLGWIEKELWNIEKAKEEMQKWLDINPKNDFLNYNMWLLEKEIWNTSTAFVYFKKVIQYAPISEFGLQAKIHIEELQLKK